MIFKKSLKKLWKYVKHNVLNSVCKFDMRMNHDYWLVKFCHDNGLSFYNIIMDYFWVKNDP